MAQVATEIRRGYSKSKNIKLEDCLLKWTIIDPNPTPVDKNIKMAQSRAFWFAAVGLDMRGQAK